MALDQKKRRPRGPGADMVAPGRVLRIFGMRRSGNHAIINWLLRNAPPGGAVFFNNCKPGRDPVQTHRSIEVFVDGAQRSFDDDTPLRDKIAAAGAAPLVIVSVEDSMPPEDKSGQAPLWPDAPGGESNLIIYRGFLNWSASLLQKIMGNDTYGPIARTRIMTNALKGYATALERLERPDETGATGLLYDTWRDDAAYRSARLEALGFTERENSLGAVARYGGGSSFQGRAESPDALETDRRADQMAEEDEFKLLLWITAHDRAFMTRLVAHFPRDAERLLTLAEGAQIWAALPTGDTA